MPAMGDAKTARARAKMRAKILVQPCRAAALQNIRDEDET
jgi:hypothetical protein